MSFIQVCHYSALPYTTIVHVQVRTSPSDSTLLYAVVSVSGKYVHIVYPLLMSTHVIN